MVPSSEAKFEITLPMINGSTRNNFHLWGLRVKTFLRWKDLLEATKEEVVEKIVTQETLSAIISSLGDNMLRTIQEDETAYRAWIRLHHSMLESQRLIN